MPASESYDAIVVGGGPAGSTAAATLAAGGRKVLLIEKEKFPRYHVGESLMPFCYFTLQRLGLLEELKRSSYPRKYSVQFVRKNGEISQPFYFFQHMDHDASTTWQVTRSDFDLMLLNNAREKGAEVLEETKVTNLISEGNTVKGVEARSKSGESIRFEAPYTIDASGRDALSLARNRWRVRDPHLNKIAIWTYYRGAKRDPGLDAGATTIAYIDDKGWFWFIPMVDDVASVGLVAENDYLYRDSRDPGRIFQREIPNNIWIDEHLREGRQFGDYFVTGEYSYRSRYCGTGGLILAGDAFAFLDPVFSSGVFLALWSGEKAALAVHAALSGQEENDSFFSDYGRDLCRGIEAMRKLVYAFYDPEFSFATLIKDSPVLQGRLTDCLIGDLFDKDYSELFQAVSRYSKTPDELAHGLGLLQCDPSRSDVRIPK